MRKTDLEQLWTTGRVARALAVSNARIHQFAKDGRLRPALRTPLGLLFDPRDVQRLQAMRGPEREVKAG
jgi:DNA-binding transcriptional MerR regulator